MLIIHGLRETVEKAKSKLNETKVVLLFLTCLLFYKNQNSALFFFTFLRYSSSKYWKILQLNN